ncbi:hypothetical protein Uis1B_1924 [Bifidobacterium margollesii]|uniref:DUF1819 family protein n=1 Tax=Bifidobacterium margollesii TaxID=2020964 RepID=A0A2N5J7S2_9BIFI|nr:DUF1819 family protein [Bifidobacterium margollesii]PLS30254.1 hypothetical protein Uis1B_1924 [Bifidobacterium margollesii]
MTGSYGSESPNRERYRLSFTVGGLLAPQGRIIASFFVGNDGAGNGSVTGDGEDTTRIPNSAVGRSSAGREVGERVTRIRRRVIDENVLAIRTESANARIVSEVVKRLSALTEAEIRHLAEDDVPAADVQALMWVAMCRYYAVVGEFASEVLRDRYLMGAMTVSREDYDRFILSKSMWHSELEELSDSTARKLRSNLFKAMVEAGLLEKDSDTLLPSLLGRTVTDILKERPESFRFFPMR